MYKARVGTKWSVRSRRWKLPLLTTRSEYRKTKQYIQGPLEVTKEDQMHVAELVDASCTGPSCVVDTPAQLDDCGPNLDVQHAAFVQKQHLPSAP